MPDKFGAEHWVYLSDCGEFVLKFGTCYGFQPRVQNGQVVMTFATPCEYLRRLELHERAFPTDLWLEGVTEEGYFVISQRALRGSHPPEDLIARQFEEAGYRSVPESMGQVDSAT